MRWKPYPSYTEVESELLDRVPSHWGLKRLKFAAANIIEKVAPSEDATYIGLEQIQSGNGRYQAPENTVLPEADSNRFMKGDVLFGKLRPYLAKVWKCSFDGICSSEFLTLRPHDLRQGLLAHMVLSDGFLKAVDGSTYGAKMPRASWDFIGSLRVPIPPVQEQALMEVFLDRETARIDALIAEQQILIERLKEKRQAIILHVTTKGINKTTSFKSSEVEWIGGVPEHWQILRLKYVSQSVKTGATPDTTCFAEDGMDWYTPGDFNGELYLGPAEKYISQEAVIDRVFPEGSVLIVSIGATLGKVAIAPRLCSANQQINAVVTNNSITPEFLTFYLAAQESVVRAQANSSTLGIMNQEKTRQVLIPTPPEEEQLSITAYLIRTCQKFAALISEAATSIALLQEHRSALITAVVTGKIDVREVANV